MDKQQTIAKFAQLAFTGCWKLDAVRLHNAKEHLIVRPTLRIDGREVEFEYFKYSERNGQSSFGYIVDCYDGHMSGSFIEVYIAHKHRNKTITEAKWRSCWARAQREKACFSTLLPIVKAIFDDDGHD